MADESTNQPAAEYSPKAGTQQSPQQTQQQPSEDGNKPTEKGGKPDEEQSKVGNSKQRQRNDDMVPKSQLDAVREEERRKLRRQIETLEADKAGLEEELKSVRASVQELQDRMTSGQGLDQDAIADLAAKRVSAKLEAKHNKEMSALRSDLEAERAGRRALELAKLRTDMITAAGGPEAMIVEMVKGENEAELAASIQASKATLERALDRAGLKNKSLHPGEGEPSGGAPTLQSHESAGAGGPLPAGGSAPTSVGALGSGKPVSNATWRTMREGKLREVVEQHNAKVRAEGGVIG